MITELRCSQVLPFGVVFVFSDPFFIVLIVIAVSDATPTADCITWWLAVARRFATSASTFHSENLSRQTCDFVPDVLYSLTTIFFLAHLGQTSCQTFMNPSPLQRIVDNALRFNGLATHNHRGFVCGLSDDASQQVNDGKNDQIR